MEKLHKRKVSKVYKNKKLNNANFGTYNLNDYQTFLLLVSKLGKTNTDGTYIQPEQLERTHTITAKEFSDAFNVDINTVYGVLKRASNKLARTAITLEKPELFQVWDIPICELSEYNTKEGSLTVTFNTHIMPYLGQVKKKFVLYNLKEVANFGSLYSTRLYELIQEFKDTGWLVKSVAQLREVFAVGKKFKLYADFKNRTFAHAVDEINAQYPTIKLRFEEIKEGRKVVSIDFRFTPSTIIEQYNPVTKQLVSVTQKPKQVPVAKTRKAKKSDDSTPPPVHPDQQELPHLAQEEKTKTVTQKLADKIVKSKYAENEFAPSLKKLTKKFSEDKVTKDNLKEYGKKRKAEIKHDIIKTAEEVKKIITALMEEGDLTETEATIKAIKYKLI